MLVLTIPEGSYVMIGNIKVCVDRISGSRAGKPAVRLAIDAPREIEIVREKAVRKTRNVPEGK